MRKVIWIPCLLLLFGHMAGCSYKVQLIDFDKGETLQGGFNTCTRAVWVFMPDGSRLSGKYVEIRDDKISFGSGTGSVFAGASFGAFSTFGSSFSLGSTSIGYAILKHPDSKLMMEVLVKANWDNTGMGEARTNDGRHYKVIF
jgi:hypothetical protein